MPQYVSLNITRVWEGFKADPGIVKLQWSGLPGDLSTRLASNEYVSVIGMVHKTLQVSFVGTLGTVDLEACDLDPREDSVSVAITGATQADPIEITAASHGLVAGDQVLITGVVGMTQINGNTFTVNPTGPNTFELVGEDGTGYTAYVSGGVANKAGNWYLIGTLTNNGALTDSAPRKFLRVSVVGAGNAGVNVSVVGSN